jgi:hypothetical protein
MVPAYPFATCQTQHGCQVTIDGQMVGLTRIPGSETGQLGTMMSAEPLGGVPEGNPVGWLS